MKNWHSFNRRSAAGIQFLPVPGVETPGYLRLSLRGNARMFSAVERLDDGRRGVQPTVEIPTISMSRSDV